MSDGGTLTKHPSSLLRAARLRVTPQRLAVLRVLATGAHLETCQGIWEQGKVICKNLGLVTVYRTVERLCAAGLAEQVDLNGTAHFGLTEQHHDHAICQRCGAVEATDTCLVGTLAGARLGGSGFLITGHRLELVGVCPACQAAT